LIAQDPIQDLAKVHGQFQRFFQFLKFNGQFQRFLQIRRTTCAPPDPRLVQAIFLEDQHL
jgi:hypothetical protein